LKGVVVSTLEMIFRGEHPTRISEALSAARDFHLGSWLPNHDEKPPKDGFR
jgi:hypothetical protein